MMRTPFEQNYIKADGLRTRYVDAGPKDAPVLVLLHGTGGHWETFCQNIPVLSSQYRCIALDMMGCGFTDKPDKPYEVPGYGKHVVATMDALGIKKASFIGVSLGSWVSAHIAVFYPERVEKVIMIASAGLRLDLPGGEKSSDQVSQARRNSARDPSWDNIRRVLLQLVRDPLTMLDDMIAVRQVVYSDPEIEKIMPRMLTLSDPKYRPNSIIPKDKWSSIVAPVLICSAVDDKDFFYETGQELLGIIPNVKEVEFNNTSHWTHFEDPDKFNKVALEFLNY
ncbi:alpha/beta fold hydrolase [Sphingobium xenophagum]